MEQQEIENLNKWHISKYILITENPKNKNEFLGINLLFNTYFKLTKEEYDLFLNFLNKKIEKIEDSILQKFIKFKIIVDFDEFKRLEIKAEKISKKTNNLNITICPTFNCNFDCLYCFEKHRPGKMSLETQDKTINFIKNIIENNKINQLKITWFGGEPLLALEIIQYISEKLISFCNRKEIIYTSNIITNGYLLNQNTANLLKKLKITNYQITLDGIKEKHDYTRHLINGEPTFDKIVENLINTKISGVIKIRHTLYENNQQEITKLKKLINEIKEKSGNNIYYTFGQVYPSKKTEKNKELVTLISEKNLNKILFNKKIEIPPKKIFFCMAQKLNCFTIDEQGRLYKCRDHMTEDNYFSTIEQWDYNNPIFSSLYPDKINSYLNTIAILNGDEECKKCIWLPCCGGGCPNQRLHFKKKCISYKENPKEFILALNKDFFEEN